MYGNQHLIPVLANGNHIQFNGTRYKYMVIIDDFKHMPCSIYNITQGGNHYLKP
jgi:hypothetical protein